jgi:hypothetical protein
MQILSKPKAKTGKHASGLAWQIYCETPWNTLIEQSEKLTVLTDNMRVTQHFRTRGGMIRSTQGTHVPFFPADDFAVLRHLENTG